MSDQPFTKENLDQFLKELAKEFRKRNGKSVPADIILIGGASVLINYGFREMTYDMDAIINAASSMKDTIKPDISISFLILPLAIREKWNQSRSVPEFLSRFRFHRKVKPRPCRPYA